jgi:hypothetical protein
MEKPGLYWITLEQIPLTLVFYLTAEDCSSFEGKFQGFR